MKIFFDTEFTELTKDAELISIGCIDETGTIFYGVCDDYDKSKVNEWLQKNVIDNLEIKVSDTDLQAGANIIRGTKEQVKECLLKWLFERVHTSGTVEFVSDVCHYDMVLLIDLLFGHGLEVPINIMSACCYDINQDIARFLGISLIQAFDYSREKFLHAFGLDEYLDEQKHNALYDAKVIKAIYDFITNAESRKIEIMKTIYVDDRSRSLDDAITLDIERIKRRGM